MLLLVSILLVVLTATNCYAAISVGDSVGGGTVFCVSDTVEGIKNCTTRGTGDYGLIMANVDQANFDSNPEHGMAWTIIPHPGKINNYIPPALGIAWYLATNAQSDDDGAVNTQTIIKARPLDNASNNAAWLCHNYRDPAGHAYWYWLSKNEPNKIYTYANWYLPSKNELNKMYIYTKENNLIGKNCVGDKASGVQCLIGSPDNNDMSTDYHKVNVYYWSSTEAADYNSGLLAWCQPFNDTKHGSSRGSNEGKSLPFGVRAVRIFSLAELDPLNILEVEKMQEEEEQKLAAELIEVKKIQREEEQRVEVELKSKQQEADRLKEEKWKQRVMKKLEQEAARREEFNEAMKQDTDLMALQQMIGQQNAQFGDIFTQQKTYFGDIFDSFSVFLDRSK